MSGTTEGGRKAAQIIKEKLGSDHFAKIGKRGGESKKNVRRINDANGNKE